MSRAARDAMAEALEWLGKREAVHREGCELANVDLGWTLGGLRARLEALYRALPDDAAVDGCDCRPFVQHGEECALSKRQAASNAAIEAAERRAAGLAEAADHVAGAGKKVAPEPAAPAEPAGPTDIGDGWSVNRWRPGHEGFGLRFDSVDRYITRPTIAALARFAGLVVMERAPDGAATWPMVHAANGRADAAEARAAQAEADREAVVRARDAYKAENASRAASMTRMWDQIRELERERNAALKRIERLRSRLVEIATGSSVGAAGRHAAETAIEADDVLAEAPAGRALDERGAKEAT